MASRRDTGRAHPSSAPFIADAVANGKMSKGETLTVSQDCFRDSIRQHLRHSIKSGRAPQNRPPAPRGALRASRYIGALAVAPVPAWLHLVG